jgi:peptidoglycan hydrolase-like protein with peptidoglycan-binding domain
MALGNGKRGPEIVLLQGLLFHLDYDVQIDGIFGSGTEEAVRAFQGDWELDVDGLVGEDTAHAIVSALWESAYTEEEEEEENV